MELLIGLIGAVLGIGLFVLGFIFGMKVNTPKPLTVSQQEMEQQALERERLMADQEAFKGLLGYNTDVAYQMSNSRKA